MSQVWEQGLWFDSPPNSPTWQTPETASGNLDGKPISWWRDATREALGVSRSKPVMMTGHQPTAYHPGILVKYIALAAQVGIKDATGLELVIDHHVGAAGIVQVPKVLSGTEGVGGGLIRHALPLLALNDTVPLCWQPPQQPESIDSVEHLATQDVADGLQRMHAVLSNNIDAPDAAAQLAKTMAELRSPWVEGFSQVRASKLLATPFGKRIVELMYHDPRSCVEAYNAAVEAWPTAQMRALRVESNEVELPLWTRNESGHRVPVTISTAGASVPDIDTLLPRALLITAICRIAIADLFIHGRSGDEYDKVMEQWIGQWLGVQPAGAAAISCTLLLPNLCCSQEKNTKSLDRLISLGHRLWHDPQQLDSEEVGPSPQKKRFLEMVNQAGWKSVKRKQKFIELHLFLDHQRLKYANRLEATAALSRDARSARMASDLLAARDWPFIFYPEGELSALVSQVTSELGDERVVSGGNARSSLK